MNTKELRELDAWIAEHVMGWKRNKYIQPMPQKGEFFLHHIDGVICEFGSNRKQECLFNPTTDPSAAMMVLEMCITGHTSIAINHGTTGWWIADCDKKRYWTIGETLPLAICLFAKKLFSK